MLGSALGKQCPTGRFPLTWLFRVAGAVVISGLAFTADGGQSNAEPQARPLTPKEKMLGTPWKQWLNEDVVYIITDGERKAFKGLKTDEERQYFADQFWQRRNPAPDSLENPFEEEHYRRVAFSNARFGTNAPGWRTDRGRIYITYGPPDEIETHPGKAGDQKGDYPFEDWRYHHIESIGNNVVIEFVDTTRSGEYHMTVDPSWNGSLPIPATEPGPTVTNIIELGKPPRVKFKDLEEVISTNIRYSTLPMHVRADYIRLTDATVLAPVTIGFDRGTGSVNIYGRVTSMSGRVIASFEDSLTAESGQAPVFCQQDLLLPPGVYRLNVAARDDVHGTMTNYEMVLNVPRFEAEKLSSSSLVLCDLRDKDRARDFGTLSGEEVIQPRMGPFSNNERLGVYVQFYNFAPGAKGGKPDGSIEYLVTRAGTKERLIDLTEDVASLPGESASQVTVEKVLPLNRLGPSEYTIQLKVTDRIGNQTLAPSATFTVREDRAAIDSTVSYSNPVPVPHVSLTATGAGLRMRTVFQRIRAV